MIGKKSNKLHGMLTVLLNIAKYFNGSRFRDYLSYFESIKCVEK